MMVVASLMAHAYDYPYLAFQTTDGTVTTVSVASLSITVGNGQLIATNSEGSTTFTLSQLSKMYFSTEGSTGISAVDGSSSATTKVVYDLQGRQVRPDEMKSGIYVVKSNVGTRKVSVR